MLYGDYSVTTFLTSTKVLKVLPAGGRVIARNDSLDMMEKWS